ncbi:hypothetical protein GWI33_015287 [Rhynchophorus ferrugineus]|uniref:Uncharacterized protein n=1 Tax=Rhynchophorus ferrugineus TaxID=354439 RepID=A0A834I5C7_RHYFE|nr:hypothetical protein GWI33_015287 [Rhynchophorus ferrugineus]
MSGSVLVLVRPHFAIYNIIEKVARIYFHTQRPTGKMEARRKINEERRKNRLKIGRAAEKRRPKTIPSITSAI